MSTNYFGQNSLPSEIKVRASCIRQLPSHCVLQPLIDAPVRAQEGDVLLFEVLHDSGSVATVEDQNGRDVSLYHGDLFLGVLGNRRSGTSEYGIIPNDLVITSKTQLDLLSVGGVVGIGQNVPDFRHTRQFLKVRPVAFIQSQGDIVNTIKLYFRAPPCPVSIAPTIFVGGTSAEVGKTTTCINLIQSLSRAGLKVGAVKLTGTGRLRDSFAMKDAGALNIADFPSNGLPTTYTGTNIVVDTAAYLLHSASYGADLVIAELGGDLLEANVPEILQDSRIRSAPIAFVQVVADIIGAIGSLVILEEVSLSENIHIALPKGKNHLASRERLLGRGLHGFDSLSRKECDAVCKVIIDGLGVNHGLFQ
ncbi:conserved protein of unknown function [Acidithiobacillus ferrivorans]|uniref:CobQ/CobB/MinD/ParA nucleotide binding domain-containing protein n=1 Tax=Acidithiobacillus ferrivorans TaxID=160808 RepID=A0A060UPX9_9PROT|nr:DUF1611 domain-containing protein [Acidithiobacillus ferrivorans]CDQ10470.1 hypothetical protein AFERRI_400251 [Acidithiobacillus ferrivorans]SMH64498.1 conserved protein of unknown function [Acidithiobacillus ferrivorans]